MATVKGQNLRIMVGTTAQNRKCIAAATSCTLHVNAVVGESSTKDDDSAWQTQEVTGLAWDVQTEALVQDTADSGAVDLEELTVGNTYYLMFAPTEGTKNREQLVIGSRCWGKAILTDLQIVAQNRNDSTWAAQFTGIEDLTPDSLVPPNE